MSETTKHLKLLPELHSRVLAAIPLGRANAIPTTHLMDKLAINRDMKRQVHAVIESLVMDYGQPIGTSSKSETKGIYVIQDEDDLKLAMHTLNSRAQQILNRHRKLIENFNNHHENEKN